MKCLIIDDDVKFNSNLQQRLDLLDFVADFRRTPDGGIKMANETQNYDLIFIDFKFDNDPAQTGADIGLTIRKNHPLSTLILMTAFGNEHIKDFIFVGFDNYWDKYTEGAGADLERMITDFKDMITVAQANAQKRCKSIFAEDELEEMAVYLDAIEETIEFLENNGKKGIINGHTIAAGVSLVKKNKPLDKKILQDVADAKLRKKTQSTHQLASYNYLSSDIFELREPRGGYKERALKVRQLLKNNPEKWLRTRGFKAKDKAYYNPVNVIAKEFAV